MPASQEDRGVGGDAPESSDAARARFRRTLVRVLGMQLFSLLVLWLLQARYAH